MKQTFCIVGAAAPTRLKRTIALACLMGLGLAACGQKGPLYLPPEATQTPATVPAQVPAQAPESASHSR